VQTDNYSTFRMRLRSGSFGAAGKLWDRQQQMVRIVALAIIGVIKIVTKVLQNSFRCILFYLDRVHPERPFTSRTYHASNIPARFWVYPGGRSFGGKPGISQRKLWYTNFARFKRDCVC